MSVLPTLVGCAADVVEIGREGSHIVANADMGDRHGNSARERPNKPTTDNQRGYRKLDEDPPEVQSNIGCDTGAGQWSAES